MRYWTAIFILAEELLAQPEEVRKRFYPFICRDNALSLIKKY